MSKFVVLLVLLKLLTVEGVFDPSKIDYCKLKCADGVENTACKCYVNETLEEITDNFMLFRREMLEKHNELRNRVGTGQEKETESAANMNALSYDLELEYIARCYIAKTAHVSLDPCRRSSKFEKPGQLTGFDPEKLDPFETASKIVEGLWYKRPLKYLEHINPYAANDNRDRISEFLWWSHTHVGCGRILAKEHPFPYIVVCNYGGTGPSLVHRENVYEDGKGCSKCANNANCNSEYSGLCGEISPIPTDEPAYMLNSNRSKDTKDSKHHNKTSYIKNGALTMETGNKILFIVITISLLLY